jgi:hypothetical protein
LLSTDSDVRAQERDRLRSVIRQRFASLRGQRAGIVLTFGSAPLPSEGGQLSREVNQLLRETLPDIFGDAVTRDFHRIEGDPQQRGLVEVEVYVIIEGE